MLASGFYCVRGFIFIFVCLFVVECVIPSFVSLIISAPAYLTTIRKIGQRNIRMKRRKAGVFGLVAFISVLTIYAVVWGEFVYATFVDLPGCCGEGTHYVNTDVVKQNNGPVKRELYLRAGFPPVSVCYSRNAETCRMVDKMLNRVLFDETASVDWVRYPIVVTAGWVAAQLSLWVVSHSTLEQSPAPEAG
jgi:hypothetical protein